MPTLIVSRTRMNNGRVCVGGFDLDMRRNVRLLTRDGYNHPASTPFKVGEFWSIRYNQSPRCVPPHVEDVFVYEAQLIKAEPLISQFIRTNCEVIRGPLSITFDRLLQFTGKGAAYIECKGTLPGGSVCFWEIDSPMRQNNYKDKIKYDYSEEHQTRHIPFVGVQNPAIQVINAGNLARLSLARWWKPTDAPPEEPKRCYLQLSGYYQ